MDCFTSVILAFFLAGPPGDYPKPGQIDPTIPVSRHDLGRFPRRQAVEDGLAWYAEHRRWLQWRIDSRYYEPGDWWGYSHLCGVVTCLDNNAATWRVLLAAWEADECGDDPTPHLRELQERLSLRDASWAEVRNASWDKGVMPKLYEPTWMKPLPDHRDRLPQWGEK